MDINNRSIKFESKILFTYVTYIIVVSNCTPFGFDLISFLQFLQLNTDFSSKVGIFTVKLPRNQKSVSQENTFKKSKIPKPFTLIENKFRTPSFAILT